MKKYKIEIYYKDELIISKEEDILISIYNIYEKWKRDYKEKNYKYSFDVFFYKNIDGEYKIKNPLNIE